MGGPDPDLDIYARFQLWSCDHVIAGFMPTFGPTWINMYGSLRSFSFSDEHGTLNRGVGEGVAFRGQVLVGLDVRLADPVKDVMTVAALEDHSTIQPLNVVSAEPPRVITNTSGAYLGAQTWSCKYEVFIYTQCLLTFYSFDSNLFC